MINEFKRVSVVNDIAVQAYITLRNAMLAMQGMYQKKADKIHELIGASANAEDEAYLRGAARAYEKVASDIGKFFDTKGGGEEWSTAQKTTNGLKNV